MARRIEVELTSRRDDGTWTWRAAGAKQPRGVVEGDLVPSGAKAGDVLRVDAEFDLDGITIINVLPPKGPRAEPERIQIIAPPEPPPRNYADEPAARGRGGPRRDGRPGDRGPRPGGPGGRPGGPGGRDRDRRPDRERGGGPGADRAGGPGGRVPAATGRVPGGERPAARPRRERPAPPPPPRPKAKKLRPGKAQRDAFLASLTPERRVVAEQLLKGGMPAVRSGLDEQNADGEGRRAPVRPHGPGPPDGRGPRARGPAGGVAGPGRGGGGRPRHPRSAGPALRGGQRRRRQPRRAHPGARHPPPGGARPARPGGAAGVAGRRPDLARGRPRRAGPAGGQPTADRRRHAARRGGRAPDRGGRCRPHRRGRVRAVADRCSTPWPTRRCAARSSPPARRPSPTSRCWPSSASTPAGSRPWPSASAWPRPPRLRLGAAAAGRRPAPVGPRLPVLRRARPCRGRGAVRIPPPPTAVRPHAATRPPRREAKPHGDELAHLAGTGHADAPPAPDEPSPVPASAEAKPHGDELAHLVDPATAPEPAPEPPAAPERPAAEQPPRPRGRAGPRRAAGARTGHPRARRAGAPAGRGEAPRRRARAPRRSGTGAQRPGARRPRPLARRPRGPRRRARAPGRAVLPHGGRGAVAPGLLVSSPPVERET